MTSTRGCTGGNQQAHVLPIGDASRGSIVCERYRQRSDVDSGSHVRPITSQHRNAGTPSDTAPDRRVGGTGRKREQELGGCHLLLAMSDTGPQRKIVSHPVRYCTLSIFHLSLSSSCAPDSRSHLSFCLTCPSILRQHQAEKRFQALAQLHHKALTFASPLHLPPRHSATHRAQGWQSAGT